MSSIGIFRELLPLEHQQLRGYIPAINRLDDSSIKWRKQHEAGLTLVDPGEFQWAMRKEAAKLATANTVQLAWDINGDLLTGAGYSARVTAPVVNIDFVGTGRSRSIAYILESEQLHDERRKVTTHLDALNGVNSGWREFEPCVSLATIPEVNMDNAILDAFWEFAPEALTFMPARAIGK